MSKKARHVIELARKLSLSERKVVAQSLLASTRADVEETVTTAKVLTWERDIERSRRAGTLIPYDQVRKELGLAPYAKGKQARRR